MGAGFGNEAASQTFPGLLGPPTHFSASGAAHKRELVSQGLWMFDDGAAAAAFAWLRWASQSSRQQAASWFHAREGHSDQQGAVVSSHPLWASTFVCLSPALLSSSCLRRTSGRVEEAREIESICLRQNSLENRRRRPLWRVEGIPKGEFASMRSVIIDGGRSICGIDHERARIFDPRGTACMLYRAARTIRSIITVLVAGHAHAESSIDAPGRTETVCNNSLFSCLRCIIEYVLPVAVTLMRSLMAGQTPK
ncbi:hypothetical protein ANO11243_026080 [Dothideomycetidae sp. 11243]|nr:hypothetical protein ANO11243_026080 [fungal sp. No.11243]